MADDARAIPADVTQTTCLHRAALFVALMATAVALGAAMAHLLELPNKIGLAREPYFIVQGIYAGWWQLAYVLVMQLAGILAVSWLWRRHPAVMHAALAALLCLVAAQVVFWVWTEPANVATRNWTFAPDNWETLRRQWEYSHAGGAVLQLACMAFLVISALAAGRPAAR